MYSKNDSDDSERHHDCKTDLFLHRAPESLFPSCHVISAADTKYHSRGNQQTISSSGVAVIGVRDAECENVKLNRPLAKEIITISKCSHFSYSVFLLTQDHFLEWLFEHVHMPCFVWMGSHWIIQSCTSAPHWCTVADPLANSGAMLALA